MVVFMKKKNKKNGFSLIELLVVISILAILAAVVVPSVAGFLGTSEKVKMQAIFRTWVTQIVQFKSHYGYFPPFLLQYSEGEPVSFLVDDVESKFIASLKGKVKVIGEGGWSVMSDDLTSQNPKALEFHAFSEDEFEKNGHIVAYESLKVLVDYDGDGVINLPPDLVDEILNSLASDHSPEELSQINREEFARVHEKVIFFITSNESSSSAEDDNWYSSIENVFSWNVEKYFN